MAWENILGYPGIRKDWSDDDGSEFLASSKKHFLNETKRAEFMSFGRTQGSHRKSVYWCRWKARSNTPSWGRNPYTAFGWMWRTSAEEIKESHFCIAVEIASVNKNSFGAIWILCRSSIRLKSVTKRRVSILHPFAFERSIGSSLKIGCRMY